MGKRMVRISNELVVNVLSTGWNTGDRRLVCIDGLPDGAELIDARVCRWVRGVHPPDLELIFEHPAWEDDPNWVELPYLAPTYQSEAIQEEC